MGIETIKEREIPLSPFSALASTEYQTPPANPTRSRTRARDRVPVPIKPRCGENELATCITTSGKKCERPPYQFGIRLIANSSHGAENPLPSLRSSLDRLGFLGLLLGGRGGGLLLGLVLLGGSTLGTLVAIGRGPESEVIAQKLHDQGAVTVALLGEGVELGNGIVKGLLGEVAGTVWRVEDLVVEDGEVQRETKTNGVGRGEISLGNIGGALDWRVSHVEDELARSIKPEITL